MASAYPLLIALICLCASACQQSTQSTLIEPVSQGAPFTPRPIAPQKITFKREYYSSDQVDQLPVPIDLPRPRYPNELREAGVDGIIHLGVAIDEKGNVSEVETFAASDERFAASAKEAVLRWKFKPARKNGQATRVWRLLPVRFTLK